MRNIFVNSVNERQNKGNDTKPVFVVNTAAVFDKTLIKSNKWTHVFIASFALFFVICPKEKHSQFQCKRVCESASIPRNMYSLCWFFSLFRHILILLIRLYARICEFLVLFSSFLLRFRFFGTHLKFFRTFFPMMLITSASVCVQMWILLLLLFILRTIRNFLDI